jgi:thiosulfate/3-mercaptopyruvate sulfurtransferase
MKYTTLIDTATLATRLGEPALVVVDCRFDLSDSAAGERAYQDSHIPGAIYAHLGRDLAAPRTGTNGRHPLPSPAAAIERFGHLGVSNQHQVVAYDQDTGMYASRLWWMLRWLGHDAVAVLDGGFAQWIAEARPTSRTIETRTPEVFTGVPRPGWTVSVSEVPSLAASPDIRVVDARAPERFRGEVEPIDPVAGHIPGAVNHFFGRNLVDGRFRTPEALREGFRDSLGSVRGDQVVCYCGSGVTACHNVLALEHAGLPGARLYPGSWSEWVSDPTRPIERG